MTNFSYKVEINPTNTQKKMLEEYFLRRKCAWNWALGLCKDLYQWKLIAQKRDIKEKDYNLPGSQKLNALGQNGNAKLIELSNQSG